MHQLKEHQIDAEDYRDTDLPLTANAVNALRKSPQWVSVNALRRDAENWERQYGILNVTMDQDMRERMQVPCIVSVGNYNGGTWREVCHTLDSHTGQSGTWRTFVRAIRKGAILRVIVMGSNDHKILKDAGLTHDEYYIAVALPTKETGIYRERHMFAMNSQIIQPDSKVRDLKMQ